MFIQLKKEYFAKKPGERVEVDNPVAEALIKQGVADPVQGDHLGNLIEKELSATLENITKGLNDTVAKTLQEFSKAQCKARKNSVPAIFGEGGEGDPKRTFGSFLLAVAKNDQKALEEMGSRLGQKAALTTAAGAQGGYTVPIEFMPNLMAIAAESSIVESRATVIPMASTSMEIPALDVVTAPSAGNTAFFGGLSAAWTEEAAALTEKEPAFKQIRLTAHELSGYSLAANALLADNAIGLESLLLNLFGGALAWYKDYAFLRGDGAGKPLGVINATAFKAVTRSGASAFVLADAAKMLAGLLPGWNIKNTAWVMHPGIFEKLVVLADAGSTMIFLDNAREKPTMTLFGFPVLVSEKLPGVNTAGDVILCDFKHYIIGDRQSVEIAYSEHFKFTSNQGTWRFVTRCDGAPWLRDKVTLADASTTLSPFVGLAAG